MLVYKIVHKNYANTLSSSGIDGRWTSGGRKVIYCASSAALALLENMIRRQGVGFNDDFRTVVINIPASLQIEAVPVSALTPGWRDFRDYELCQQIGNKWYDAAASPILQVPSAILPQEANFVLSEIHPAFKKIKITAVTNLLPDPRIEDLLRNYKKS